MQNITLPINFFDQDRIKALRCQQEGNTTLLLYLMLVCVAVKANMNGALMIYGDIPYDENTIGNLYGIPVKQVKDMLNMLIRFNLLVLDNGVYHITNPAVFSGNKKRKKALNTQVERKA